MCFSCGLSAQCVSQPLPTSSRRKYSAYRTHARTPISSRSGAEDTSQNYIFPLVQSMKIPIYEGEFTKGGIFGVNSRQW